MQSIREETNEDDASTTAGSVDGRSLGDRSATSREGWSNMQCHQSMLTDKESIKSDLITLDTGSTLDLFGNRALVEDLHEVQECIRMFTNVGDKKICEQATVPGYGKVWFDENAIANIFSFASLVKKYRVTYDSAVEDAFIVHMKSHVIKFTGNKDGLYQYKVTLRFKKGLKQMDCVSVSSHMIDSVAENRQNYTSRQFEDAKAARKLYHILGAPTIENFKKMLRANFIANCPVTPQDVDIAEKIFGPDLSTLKGKTTRRKTGSSTF